MTRTAWIVVFLAATWACSGRQLPSAGGDAGGDTPPVDAGNAPDAGAGVDGGRLIDAGPREDAGGARDAGAAMDSGSAPDAGPRWDAGPDAGPVTDMCPGGGTGTFGASCDSDSMCSCPAPWCAAPMGAPPGFCTIRGCLTRPTVCPTDFYCLDLSGHTPGGPEISICAPL